MTDTPLHRELDTPGPLDLLVELGRGSLTVTLVEAGGTTLDVRGKDAERVTVEVDGDRLRVASPRGGLFSSDPRLDVDLVVPAGSRLDLRTGSADVRVSGRYGDAVVRTGSGDVDLDEASADTTLTTGSGDTHARLVTGATDVRTGSGQVDLEHLAAPATISTGSGDVRVGEATAAAELRIKTGSGDVRLGDVACDLSFTSGSGDLVAARVQRGVLTVRGASCDVRLGVPAGVPVWTDVNSVSGDFSSTLAPVGPPADGQDHVALRATTVSGDIALHPA
ncbi:DUF4097 family beta strand repeat-containing protein [Nocardioides bruguierae]|uniref:DUF4097 family beta strand repeat-containing protein n=1 Tax=Nocardioides bruguierae TaxID=2945102 RepID=A0A9X2D721_9ACTN|nr:DUF4097 family beta strand repeat-containing protein [Nocardioides bruguierae]MCM0620341.1 DUF4097 family beta strand repeat-containing protein [Nocardioides bruguierae]